VIGQGEQESETAQDDPERRGLAGSQSAATRAWLLSSSRSSARSSRVVCRWPALRRRQLRRLGEVSDDRLRDEGATRRVARTDPRETASLGIVLGCLASCSPCPDHCAGHPGGQRFVGIPAVGAGLGGHERRQAARLARSGGESSEPPSECSPPTRARQPRLRRLVDAALHRVLAFATPLTFAAIGGMFSERKRGRGLGLEGMMLTRIFSPCSVRTSSQLGSWPALRLIAGGVAALIHAFVRFTSARTRS